MNRRGFFKSLAALTAAASAPGIFIPKFDPVRWKVLNTTSGILVPNPAWINAPYELMFIAEGGYWSQKLREIPRNLELTDPKNIYPVRYALTDPVTFMPVEIPPFIRK